MVTILLTQLAAHACGGFFCNNNEPVDQSAERILFSHDLSTGEVEAHVQIFYSGPSEGFAWVVPVPSEPEIFLSSDQLFTDLSNAYRPTFSLVREEEEWCTPEPYDYNGLNGGGGYNEPEPAPTVEVVASDSVGPYDTVTLKAESSDGLIDWLQDNGFDLPDELSAALDPYIGDNLFVAMKLTKDASEGSVQPIGLRYTSAGLSVPIQLTSIAAQPDMRVEAYVLGDFRAVPGSYLHVQINEAAIDWFHPDGRYEQAVSRAANEAGGHAFATDYSGAATMPFPQLYTTAYYDTEAVAAAATAADAMDAVMDQFEPTGLVLQALIEFMPPPAGIQPDSFYNCVSCYVSDDYPFDGPGLAAALEERIVVPRAHLGDLFERFDHLTVLTSSLDAAEMTVDPTFVFNRDMVQEVDNKHYATLRYLCGDGDREDQSPRQLVLADGRTFDLPSEAYLERTGQSEADMLMPESHPAAIVIEITSGTEEPITLADYREEGAANTADGKGCGCATSSSPAAILLWLAPLLGWRRRRG